MVANLFQLREQLLSVIAKQLFWRALLGGVDLLVLLPQTSQHLVLLHAHAKDTVR